MQRSWKDNAKSVRNKSEYFRISGSKMNLSDFQYFDKDIRAKH